MIDFVLIALATWYVAYALTSTHGPGGVFEWVRENVWHGRGRKPYEVSGQTLETATVKYEPVKNGLMDCPICLSFWVGLALFLLPFGVVTQALAAAGLAMLLHGFSGWRYNVR